MLIHSTFWQHWPSILLRVLSLPGKNTHPPGPRTACDPGVISDMPPNCGVAVLSMGSWHPLLLCKWGDPDSRDANGFLLPKYLKEALWLCHTGKAFLADNEQGRVSEWPLTQLQWKRNDLTIRFFF